MKTKEKAKQLYDRFYDQAGFIDPQHKAKKCALIAVSEIKSALISYGEDSDELQNMDSEFRWWDEVENELSAI